ncbi:hypothetical protein H9P43_004992 [Blastocladiella emersonii ATCC 22665]|nr:hypothetical protein H9P43_004992 [Blastocladiella emersonii ATCC 22665]
MPVAITNTPVTLPPVPGANGGAGTPQCTIHPVAGSVVTCLRCATPLLTPVPPGDPLASPHYAPHRGGGGAPLSSFTRCPRCGETIPCGDTDLMRPLPTARLDLERWQLLPAVDLTRIASLPRPSAGGGGNAAAGAPITLRAGLVRTAVVSAEAWRTATVGPVNKSAATSSGVNTGTLTSNGGSTSTTSGTGAAVGSASASSTVSSSVLAGLNPPEPAWMLAVAVIDQSVLVVHPLRDVGEPLHILPLVEVRMVPYGRFRANNTLGLLIQPRDLMAHPLSGFANEQVVLLDADSPRARQMWEENIFAALSSARQSSHAASLHTAGGASPRGSLTPGGPAANAAAPFSSPPTTSGSAAPAQQQQATPPPQPPSQQPRGPPPSLGIYADLAAQAGPPRLTPTPAAAAATADAHSPTQSTFSTGGTQLDAMLKAFLLGHPVPVPARSSPVAMPRETSGGAHSHLGAASHVSFGASALSVGTTLSRSGPRSDRVLALMRARSAAPTASSKGKRSGKKPAAGAAALLALPGAPMVASLGSGTFKSSASEPGTATTAAGDEDPLAPLLGVLRDVYPELEMGRLSLRPRPVPTPAAAAAAAAEGPAYTAVVVESEIGF